jgi:hypothetical protein
MNFNISLASSLLPQSACNVRHIQHGATGPRASRDVRLPTETRDNPGIFDGAHLDHGELVLPGGVVQRGPLRPKAE